VEQYGQDRRLARVFVGRTAGALCDTIVRHGQVSVLQHAAYLGRELAKAEAALRLGLDYEQDVSLRLGAARE
jgi:tetrahydromethanopterin S-methyltransferase subunit A